MKTVKVYKSNKIGQENPGNGDEYQSAKACR